MATLSLLLLPPSSSSYSYSTSLRRLAALSLPPPLRPRRAYAAAAPRILAQSVPSALAQDDLKKLAAERAVEYVSSCMVLGLGTGSTAAFVVAEIGALFASGKLSGIVGVPTSKRTFEQARSLGIPLSTLDDHPHINLAIDGADEGLLSEVFAVLADQRCDVVEAKPWTHNGRIVALVLVRDADSGCPVPADAHRVARVESRLRNVLRGSGDRDRDQEGRGARAPDRARRHAPGGEGDAAEDEGKGEDENGRGQNGHFVTPYPPAHIFDFTRGQNIGF